MLHVLIQSALVILAGVYAIRSASFLFEGQFELLTPVAALAFVFSIAVFYRPPATQGIWFYLVLAACLAGFVANTLLLIYPDKEHESTTNLAFSAISIAGWAIVGLSFAWSVFGRQGIAAVIDGS
jgi:hypothetical protein